MQAKRKPLYPHLRIIRIGRYACVGLSVVKTFGRGFCHLRPFSAKMVSEGNKLISDYRISDACSFNQSKSCRILSSLVPPDAQRCASAWPSAKESRPPLL